MHTDLKDRHSNRINIRVLRGELFLEPSGEPEHIRVQQLRRHPPDCAQLFANSGPAHRFIDNCRKTKVPQACATPGVY